MQSQEKTRGCLLGLAVGDALGAPLRGLKSGRVRQLFGEIDGHVDSREAWLQRPHRWSMPGLHSSVTQSALSVTDTLVNSPDLRAEKVESLWAQGVRIPDLRGQRFGLFRNPTPRLEGVLRSLVRPGATARSAAQPTVEAAALTIPLALTHRSDDETFDAAMASVALLLASDPKSISGAMSVGLLVAMFLEGWDADSAAAALPGRLREAEERLLIAHLGVMDLSAEEDEFDPLHAMSRALEAIPGLLSEGDDDLAVATLMRQGHHLAPRAPMSSFNSGHPLTTLPILIFLALAHQRFAAPVARVASEGKESALCAGILGALLGARLGEEAIPSDWLSGLVGFPEISKTADALAGKPVETSPWLECEAGLTSREVEARMPLVKQAEKERAGARQRSKPRGPKPTAAPDEPMPFSPPPHTYLGDADDPRRKQRERAARGRKRIAWKEERRRREDPQR